MRKPQPFFLQVSPPKSLYWPLLYLRAAWARQGTTTAPLCHCCHSSPAASHLTALMSTSPAPLQPHTGAPVCPESPTAIGIVALPLQSDEDQLSCRSRAAWLSWHPLHQCTTWRSKPKNNCIFPKRAVFRTFHMNSTLHTLGLNVQLLQWLLPAGDRTLGKARRKLWFSEGSVLRQAAEIILVTWLFEQFTHMSGSTAPTDTTMEPRGTDSDPRSRAWHKANWEARCQAWDHSGLEWFWITGIRHFSAHFSEVM